MEVILGQGEAVRERERERERELLVSGCDFSFQLEGVCLSSFSIKLDCKTWRLGERVIYEQMAALAHLELRGPGSA